MTYGCFIEPRGYPQLIQVIRPFSYSKHMVTWESPILRNLVNLYESIDIYRISISPHQLPTLRTGGPK